MDFENKVILITGAASGIGKEIATSYAKLNGIVLITDNNKKKGEELVYSIKKGDKKLILPQSLVSIKVSI